MDFVLKTMVLSIQYHFMLSDKSIPLCTLWIGLTA